MMNEAPFSPLDNNSVSSSDLFSIISELSCRRLLGRLALECGESPCGFLFISPALTAELIKIFSMLPATETGARGTISFDTTRLALRLHGGSLLEMSELVRIAKLSALAGFDEHYTGGDTVEFASQISPNEEYPIYAISPEHLREIFRKYFPSL